ncbi:MAG: SHOCT domain-containing protein [Colwellia sp.]|nr:SHOCT domain-containing protein [Colwellia sp.]
MMLIISCLLISLTTAAEKYRLDVFAQLPTLSSANNIAVIPLPIKSDKNNQYLLADETGQLSLLSGTKLLSLAHLPLSDTKNTPHVKLTALTLHPSFSLANKTGYQTFFTAHIEPIKTNNNVARLTRLENPITLPFDAVITQWKYHSSAPKIIDVQQRREVLRIAVPTATHQIQKIAFNPYNKVWHDDYGLMHIALSGNSEEDSTTSEDALYSGVVLRINPEKFGLRNYRVPSNNPFVKAYDINKEIFILGAKNIKSFSWSKQHHDALLVQHTYDGAHKVAVAKKGTDWREAYQNKLVFPLKLNNESHAKIFTYYGRKLKTLVGSILYLSKNRKNWQLAKFDTTTQHSEMNNEIATQTIELLNSEELAPQSNVSLHFDHAGEPLLLDSTKKQLLSITTVQLKTDGNNNVQTEDTQAEQPSEENNSAYGKLLLTLFILVLSVVFYRLRPQKNSVIVKLRNQFARFELDDTKTTLSFYKRHQSKIDSHLLVSDIINSEIVLNDKNISTINKDTDNSFNEQRESQLRLSFSQAHRHKLIGNDIRQVTLYITDKSTKTHVVSLYLRKGNQRLTKVKYTDTLEAVIDWSWFIASQLNPEETGSRKIKKAVVNKSIIKTPKKPITNPVIAQEPTKTKQTQEELRDIAVHDSELINALDKLVNLKQQGFLTDEEFSLAKAKILSDMMSNK